ncbi:hypothetical protein C4559_04675 [Candidatus Microgenomates bacterium]|nr:MAG: hypothetical protein C4559_04675 [Candidatus Microgenomates bacterium]
MKKQKKQAKQFVSENAVEALRGIGQGVVNSFKKDVTQGIASDFWAQMLGKNEKAKKNKEAGDLNEGEELDLSNLKKKENTSDLSIDPGIDYRREILQGEKRIIQETTRGIEVKIQEIIIELKKLTSTSQELQAQFKEVTIEQLPVNPGKYHLTFFEWLAVQIREARLQIEDSGAWLSACKNKKGKKQYWSMFKKHGTTFGLSNERVVATQTG